MVENYLKELLIVLTGLLSRFSSSRYWMVRILSWVLGKTTFDKYLFKSTTSSSLEGKLQSGLDQLP